MQRSFSPAYAVVRVDDFHGPGVLPQDKITVKEVFSTQEEAEQEVVRLSNLNANKGCRYFWQYTRLVPPAE